MALTSETAGPQPNSLPRIREESSSEPSNARQRLLAVVDGSERTGRIVEQIKALGVAERPLTAVLLNVQPVPADGRLRGYGSFKRDEIKARLLDGFGRRAVTAAGRVLAHAGIEHKHRIEMGSMVETILRVADEEGCELILIGNAPAGPLERWLQRTTQLMFATTAGQVAQLARVPVILVK